jgi:hypothetical protein
MECRLRSRTIGLVCLIVLGSAQVHAQFQDAWGTGWNNPVSASIGSSIYWKTMTMPPKKGTSSSAQTPANSANAPAAQKARTVNFQPLKNSPTPRNIAATFKVDGVQRKELEQTFARFLEFFNTKVATGADRYNVASAAAFFMAGNYMVATGKEVPDARVEALRDALQANLLDHDKFQAMDARRRQELYETLVIYAMLSQAGFQEGEKKNDAKQMNNFRELARQNLNAVLGATPEQMVFTTTGLMFK